MGHLLFIDDQPEELSYFSSFLSDDHIIDLEQEPVCYENHLQKNNYDAIIIDIHMPIIDGFALREKIINSPYYNHCPIIFKTSYTSDENIIKGLSTQCEFLTPNMKAEQISLRIQNQINKHHVKLFGELSFNFKSNKLFKKQKHIELTTSENNIVRLFFLNNFFLTRQYLTNEIWGPGFKIQNNTINTHILNLRKKLEPHGLTIRAERGKGYLLEFL